MAEVYVVRHTVLGTRHAAKVLDPDLREDSEVRRRFLDEARIQASHLSHPNIVKVVNIVSTPEHAALVMDLVDGPSLEVEAARLSGSPDEIRRIMFGILDAVGHAHDAGIIHRDLKPANVLLDGKARTPKVTDFGIAKVRDANRTAKNHSTHTSSRMGTLSYMSPEQLLRAKDVTPRSDIFSLGVLLYELATGVLPFDVEGGHSMVDLVLKGRYPAPELHNPRIDPTIAAVIRRSIDADPMLRFATCDEMALALGRVTGRPADLEETLRLEVLSALWLEAARWKRQLESLGHTPYVEADLVNTARSAALHWLDARQRTPLLPSTSAVLDVAAHVFAPALLDGADLDPPGERAAPRLDDLGADDHRVRLAALETVTCTPESIEPLVDALAAVELRTTCTRTGDCQFAEKALRRLRVALDAEPPHERTTGPRTRGLSAHLRAVIELLPTANTALFVAAVAGLGAYADELGPALPELARAMKLGPATSPNLRRLVDEVVAIANRHPEATPALRGFLEEVVDIADEATRYHVIVQLQKTEKTQR